MSPRWPAFTPKVIDVGARAIFGFPVRIGAARIGALNLYRDRPGPLSDDQHADALVMADVIARTVLDFQAHTEPGSIPAEFDTDIHAVVHQAAGMVSVQLDISVADALVRLRAHAFAADRPLTEVAGRWSPARCASTIARRTLNRRGGVLKYERRRTSPAWPAQTPRRQRTRSQGAP